jgi:cysteine synthase B
MGTTGTIMGNSKYLKEKSESIRIIGVQPKEGESIPGIRKWSPAYLPAIYDASRVDDILYVSRQESIDMTKRLAKEAGVFAGMSSGGVQVAVVQLAQRLKTPATIVSIVCDRGDRYLSSGIFSD